ncbi:MAG: hypothetical protein ACOC9E_07040 [Chloroflexota bacterium]
MMTTNDESVSLSERQGDDLRAITGIGPRFANALHKIGIYRYADLAEHTAEQLSSSMAAIGTRIGPDRIEADDWIGQARKLAGGERATSAVANSDPAPASAVQSQVHQHAEFSLFFDYVTLETGEEEWQTRLYHAESGQEALLTGTDAQTWTSWILEHANLPAPGERPAAVEDEEVVTSGRPVHPYNVTLKIVDVEVASDEAGEQYEVAVHFALVGPDAYQVAGERPPYAVEVQTVDLEAGAIGQFVESGQLQLQPDQAEYTVRHTLPMPDRGRYELHTVVSVEAPAAMLAYHTGPTLNIV